jgi:glutamine cyclotransferase
MNSTKADILREYGPFESEHGVAGVTFDGEHVWVATGDALRAVDPDSGDVRRTLDVASHAGTAFDGRHLYQIDNGRIHRIDAKSGRLLGSIPAPGNGSDSGLAWAEGSLWVGQYRERKIREVDPQTGKVLREIESNRFVTGVTWTDGELWHGTWEDEQSELRHIDPQSGKVLDVVEMPAGVFVSGLESDGMDRFYCGGGKSHMVRAVKRPR